MRPALLIYENILTLREKSWVLYEKGYKRNREEKCGLATKKG